MCKEKMEQVRNKLHDFIVSGNSGYGEILEVSQELDDLILNFMFSGRERTMEDKYSSNVEGLLRELKVFEKMYQKMRIVDPLKKKVIEYMENSPHDTAMNCYEFWNRGEFCKNCISMRAYNEDDTFVKIEHNKEGIYMTTAIPIMFGHQRFVLEFLKNVTNNFYLESGQGKNSIEIYSLIKELNNAAIKDELTGIYNRRYINERLPIDLLSVSIGKEPLSIIFADLDHFKRVNDKYGHKAGDIVLKEFAAELQNYIRRDRDWAARYGGEEFMICFSDTDNETALKIAERIRKRIEDKEFKFEDKSIRLTSSFGVYTVEADECLNMDNIIELVDKKLYQAKNSGRNRVL